MGTNSTVDLFVIITVCAGILQIILFFKIWQMTNDVSKIRNKGEKSDLITKAKVSILKGDRVKAQEILNEAFFTEIATAKIDGNLEEINPYSKIIMKYEEIYEDLNIVTPNFSLYNNPLELYK